MKKIITGSKGSKGQPASYVPVEDPNSLRSKATARVIDLLCEGEIDGLVNGEESIYLDEIPLKTGGTYNYSGVTTWERVGTPTQSYIPHFKDIESNFPVSVQLLAGISNIQPISADVDDVRVILQVPSLLMSEDDGDIRATSVEVRIAIKPAAGIPTTVADIVISGKCTTTYQKAYLVKDLVSYGAGPWDLYVTRLTPDSTSVKLQNSTYFGSYVEIKNEKLIYPDSALIGCEIDAQQFGDKIPSRAYRIKGLKIKYPSNYTPSNIGTVNALCYNGAWDGTFTTGYCNNPAWVFYDLLTNKRYGGRVDEAYVDKWALYTIGVYCDAVRAGVFPEDEDSYYFEGVDDGFGGKEARFSFNGVIQTRDEALNVLSFLASTFRAFPLYSNAYVSAVQDIPTNPTRVVTNANVIDGLFTYEGTGLKARHTVCNVSWNDLDDFGRLAIETIYDPDGIADYGYNPIDYNAFGCTSRGQARRIGRWVLDTELHATEIVKYVAGWDHADILPGEVINIADNHYAAARFGGRAVSGTTTQLVIDNAVTLDVGETYTLSFQSPDATITTVTITNAKPYTGTILTFAAIAAGKVVEANAVWIISATNLATRQFRVVTKREVEAGKFEISALLYDPNKYVRIEGIQEFDTPPTSRLETGKLIAPSGIIAATYDYVEGPNQVHKYGVKISWIHSTDPRKIEYDVEVKEESSAWYGIGKSADSFFDWRPTNLYSEDYEFRVRAVGITGYSNWEYSPTYTFSCIPGTVEDVTGLQVVGGGTVWSGQDCQIEWTDATSTTFGYYRVEVYDGLNLRRADSVKYPYYTYTHELNADDNTTPIRSIGFKVYLVDIYGQFSLVPATLTATNPVPSLSGITPTVDNRYAYLNISWTNITDNDMSHYIILGGTVNPPVTEVGRVSYPVNSFDYNGLDFGTTYYVKIVPYDLFGVGTASNVGSGSPLLIPDINVDIELSNSVTITAPSFAGTPSELYNQTLDSGGVTSANPNGLYIQYTYEIENYFDRIGIWSANANPRVYVAYSDDDGSTWSYLKAEADHTTDVNNSLLAAANQADAITNYWQLSSGFNIAMWPDNLTATQVRLYFVNTNATQIYELIPSRIIISELAAIENLSAISADIGHIQAGTLQSEDWDANSGAFIDLGAEGNIILGGYDNWKFMWDGLNQRLIIRGGNLDADTVLDGVAASAIAGWAFTGDTTIIDGGKIYAGSAITLGDGGYIHGTDKSFLITTSGSNTVLLVGEEGAIEANGTVNAGYDYLIMSNGEVTTYKWINGAHREFKSLTRTVVGTAENGTETSLGYFAAPPQVILSPANLQSYNASYTGQSQTFDLAVIDLHQHANGDWYFTPRARLVLAQAANNTSVGLTGSNQTLDCDNNSDTVSVTTPLQTSEVTINVAMKSVHPDTVAGTYFYRKVKFRARLSGVAQAYSGYQELGATLDYVSGMSQSYTITTPGSYSLLVEGCGTDVGVATFQASAPEYEYTTSVAVTTLNQTDIVEANAVGSSIGVTDTGTINSTVTMPAAPAGYSEQYQIKYETAVDVAWCGRIDTYKSGSVNFKLHGNNNVHPNDLQNTLQSAGKGTVTYTGSNTTGLPNIKNTLGDNDCTVVTDLPDTYTFTKTIDGSATDTSHSMTLSAYAKMGYTQGYLKVKTVTTTRYWRRLKSQSTTKSTIIRFDSYSYKLAATTILATGTVNYMAIG